jgi:calnexin
MKTVNFVLLAAAAAAADEFDVVEEDFSVPSTDGAAFAETFQTDPFAAGRWVKSSLEKYAGQEVSVSSSKLPAPYDEDKSLHLQKEATNYGVVAKFATPINTAGKDLVVQYELKLPELGLECGGAYVKLLKHDESLDSASLKDDTPYVIMFGPDKCGTTNKVRLIACNSS